MVQEPFLYPQKQDVWSDHCYVDDLLRVCKLIVQELQLSGLQGSRLPTAPEMSRLDKNIGVMQKFTRWTECAAFLQFPNNVTSHVQKD